MNTFRTTTGNLEDAKVDVKIKLSALWAALMFLYTYGDILGFYTPGVVEQLIAGEVGAIEITEGFLIVMAVWMTIPSLMLILSLALKARANRWVNIILGFVSLAVLVASSFAGEFSLRYGFTATVEAVIMVFIIWYAWKWPRQEIVDVAA